MLIVTDKYNKKQITADHRISFKINIAAHPVSYFVETGVCGFGFVSFGLFLLVWF
jgi:hypothetical protein